MEIRNSVESACVKLSIESVVVASFNRCSVVDFMTGMYGARLGCHRLF